MGNDFSGGVPRSYEEAYAWADRANGDKDEFANPMWSFDCGLKLDFDGPILSVESRFYPPYKTHHGAMWEGALRVNFFEKEIIEKNFEAEDLDTLKLQVEQYLKELAATLVRPGWQAKKGDDECR